MIIRGTKEYIKERLDRGTKRGDFAYRGLVENNVFHEYWDYIIEGGKIYSLYNGFEYFSTKEFEIRFGTKELQSRVQNIQNPGFTPMFNDLKWRFNKGMRILPVLQKNIEYAISNGILSLELMYDNRRGSIKIPLHSISDKCLNEILGKNNSIRYNLSLGVVSGIISRGEVKNLVSETRLRHSAFSDCYYNEFISNVIIWDIALDSKTKSTLIENVLPYIEWAIKKPNGRRVYERILTETLIQYLGNYEEGKIYKGYELQSMIKSISFRSGEIDKGNHMTAPRWYRKYTNKKIKGIDKKSIHQFMNGKIDDCMLTDSVRDGSWYY